tara:strand:+ start:713 stop:2176 length:1464 start_codon:yes stop_codon:yes gene_type:complete
MAIIYTYPPATDLESSDLFLVSNMKEEGRPTRSVSLGKLASVISSLLPPSGTVTSVGLSIDESTALSVDATSTPVTTSGTLGLEWNGDSAQVVLGDGTLGTYASSGTVTSVGLSGPSAFSVSGSPVTASGTLTFTGAGTTLQYIDGTGSLQSFPTIPSVPTNIVETVDTTDGTYINLTPGTAQSGNVTVTADLSASGTASSTTFLRGDNTWAAVPAGSGTVTGTGTTSRVPLWSDGPNGVLSDSIIKDIGGGILQVGTPPSGVLTATKFGNQNITADAFGGREIIIGDLTANTGGIAKFNGDVIIGAAATDELSIVSKVGDSAGNFSSAAGEVLASNAAGQLEWSSTTDVKQLDVAITAAQMLSLNGGNTIQLLPAPGSTKMYTILNALTNLKFNTIAFNFATSGPSDFVSLSLGTTSLSNDFGLTTTNLNSATSTYFIGDPVGTGASVQVPVNVALNLTSTSGITVSQGDSIVKFSILYREIDYAF